MGSPVDPEEKEGEPFDLAALVELGIERVEKRLGIGANHPDRDDLQQRCWELALRNAHRLEDHPSPGALLTTIFRRLDRDHSWRNSGWSLTEWDARSLFTARQDVVDDNPTASRDDINLVARSNFEEDGHDASVYDVVAQGQLSLFGIVGGDEEPEALRLIDTIPDPDSDTEAHYVEVSFADFLNDELDEDAGLVLELHLAGLAIGEINEALDLGSYWTTRRILNGAIETAREWAGANLEDANTQPVETDSDVA